MRLSPLEWTYAECCSFNMSCPNKKGEQKVELHVGNNRSGLALGKRKFTFRHIAWLHSEKSEVCTLLYKIQFSDHQNASSTFCIQLCLPSGVIKQTCLPGISLFCSMILPQKSLFISSGGFRQAIAISGNIGGCWWLGLPHKSLLLILNIFKYSKCSL